MPGQERKPGKYDGGILWLPCLAGSRPADLDMGGADEEGFGLVLGGQKSRATAMLDTNRDSDMEFIHL